MPVQVDVVETYWKVCWKWVFPYPCKRSRVVRKWAYEFSYLVVAERLFYDYYRGCEFNIEYSWTDWHILPSQIEDWIFYFVTRYYKTLRPVSGSCGPQGGGDDVILTNSPLAKFIDSRILRLDGADKNQKS